MVRKSGLGRGLASLIPRRKKNYDEDEKKEINYFGNDVELNDFRKKPDNKDVVSEEKNRNLPAKIGDLSLRSIFDIPVDQILPNPHQPRKYFGEDKLAELADSIKKHGILQPLIVSRNEGSEKYELIAGERRLEASKIAGLEKVPAIIRKPSEQEKLELALVENIQRHNLNVIEEARAYKKLQDEFNLTQEQVAERVGKSRSTIANITRLLFLPIEIQRALAEGKLNEGHARMLLAISNPEKQRALFEIILKDNLTVRQVEERVKEIVVSSHQRKVRQIDQETKQQEDELAAALGTRVKIKKGKKNGQIQIDFYSLEEFNSLFKKLIS